MPIRCDIFCNVVDNYGDIGVCWRLARQLSNEHGLAVRLWVDDLHSLGKLCPEVDVTLDEQRCRGVEIRLWPDDFPVVEPFDLAIEAFACKLPESYVQAMAQLNDQSTPEAKMDAAANTVDVSPVVRKPVWLNLEYLSAEDWVEGCHKLPSPHPNLPLTKYFFFPGFTDKTGGLLLERDLLERRDAFQFDAVAQARYWRNLGVSEHVKDELRVSLFGYENEAMEGLLHRWEHGRQLITCLVPEGRSLPQVAAYFGQSLEGSNGNMQGTVWQRGNLRVHVLPFVEQEHYDELLWACDINFVRGEDSCIRAQWAAKPFIWQIYPQHDGAHLAKLEALRRRYTAGLPAEAAQVVQDLWLAWNGGQNIAGAWTHFAALRGVLNKHGVEWAKQLASSNLAMNLLDFYRRHASL